MGEKMTLVQMANDLLAIIEGDRPRLSKAEMRDYVRELFRAYTIHLTQPAQAVDVGAIEAVVSELRKWPKEETLYDHRATRLACADKLAGAIGEGK